MSDDTGTSIRRGPLFKATLEALRDSATPRRAAEVIAEVRRRVPFTDHEASLNPSGRVRGATAIRFDSSWAKIAGWIDKTSDGWGITERGLRGLGEVEDDARLYKQMIDDYERAMKLRRATDNRAALSAKLARLEAALDFVDAGSWTTSGDLEDVASLSAKEVENFLASSTSAGAHRVFSINGSVRGGMSKPDASGDADRLLLLRAEGVDFDEGGRASQAQRLTAYELAQLLDGEGADTPRRAWLIRGSNVNGKNLVPVWLERGSCSVAASQIRALTLPLTRAEIVDVVEEDYSQKSYNTRNEKVTELDLFLNRIRVGDVVVTNDGSSFFLGEVVGEATSVASTDERSNLRRAVVWSNPAAPIDLNDLPASVKPKLSSQHPIIDLTAEIAALRALIKQDETTKVVADKVATPELRLSGATDELASELLVSRDWIQSCIDLLADRRQMIFYGPPGTGKTYLARKIAEHLTDPSAVKLVQFHPAYSYEDFFEGYRPAPAKDGSGTVGFALTPGPFRRLVDSARDNQSTPYILIIDEINRANLAKVFGELYFLLEYRNSAIDLLYSTGDEAGFTMPPNVFIIGTMNTADRSIALVDAAMRRRFAFKALHPSTEPTRGLLSAWLTDKGLPQTTAAVLERLNGMIKDDDFKIGPSYFMRDGVHADGGLEVAWETSILPLLEEHHFGEGIDVAKEYALTRILRQAGAADGGSTESVGSSDPVEVDDPTVSR